MYLLFTKDELSRQKKELYKQVRDAEKNIMRRAKEEAVKYNDRQIKREIVKSAKLRFDQRMQKLVYRLDSCDSMEQLRSIALSEEDLCNSPGIIYMSDDDNEQQNDGPSLKFRIGIVIALCVLILSAPVMGLIAVIAFVSFIIFRFLVVPVTILCAPFALVRMIKNHI